MPTSISARLSATIVGVLFIIPGLIKTVDFNKELQKHMLAQFRNFSTVFPFSSSLGFKAPAPRFYMEFVGVFEVVCGVLLLAGLPLARKCACSILMIIMSLVTYNQFRLGNTSSLVAPIGYIGLLFWTFLCLRRENVDHIAGAKCASTLTKNSRLQQQLQQYDQCLKKSGKSSAVASEGIGSISTKSHRLSK